MCWCMIAIESIIRSPFVSAQLYEVHHNLHSCNELVFAVQYYLGSSTNLALGLRRWMDRKNRWRTNREAEMERDMREGKVMWLGGCEKRAASTGNSEVGERVTEGDKEARISTQGNLVIAGVSPNQSGHQSRTPRILQSYQRLYEPSFATEPAGGDGRSHPC